MFTGLIENLGIVTDWAKTATSGVLRVRPQPGFADIKLGESIAVNGCCLTVISDSNGELAFDVSDESLRKTTLGHFQVGDTVNLERAMLASTRLGGHFVLGHVDTVGEICERVEAAGSIVFKIAYPNAFAELLIEKGSVTIDGVSLTVCDLNESHFNVYIIPHTIQNTALKAWTQGRKVNLEFDVLGKYVLRQRKIATPA